MPLDRNGFKYLEGYGNVILDAVTPVVPRKPDVLDRPSYRSFSKGFNALFNRLPVLLDLMIVMPLSSVVFFILSGYWTLRSSRRIRRYKRGLASIQPGDYPVPLPIYTINVDKKIPSSQDATNTNRPSSVCDNLAHRARNQGSPLGHEESQKSHLFKHTPPILAFAPYQFRVIDAMDSLGWHKYAVHIQNAVHSHAAIIVRIQKPRYSEGYDVFRHWLDNEFMLFEES